MFEMCADLWNSRELVAQMIKRNLKIRYRQSVLGYLWVLLIPLITILFFAFLASRRILPIGETPIPYPAYALCGLVVWQLLAGVLVSSTSSFVEASHLVTRVQFNRDTLVFASIGQPLFDFSVKLFLVTFAFLWYGIVPDINSLYIPVLLIPVLLMAIGMGFFFATINLVIRDVGSIVNLLAAYGVFLAPVLYPPPVETPYSYINVINPFSPIIISIHDLISYGKLSHPETLAVSFVFSITVFIAGWKFSRLVLPKVLERI